MIPYIKGKVAYQAHVEVPDGLYEEEFARSGFFGRYAHFYRTEPPVGWTRIEGPLRPRLYDLNLHESKSAKLGNDYLQNRVSYLENRDVRIHFSQFSQPMPYFYRNADADELLFVHAGNGEIETDFGPLNYTKGDYLMIPRGTVFRLTPQSKSAFLVTESFSELRFPEKGMLGQHALFDPAVLEVPTPREQPPRTSASEYELKIKREDEYTSVFYPFYPINTIGWKGTLTVWKLNVKDIRPIVSERYHLPPSAHTTFVADNFVVCSFVPRPLENGDPKAMKVPFYHSNIDYDEVLFYHDGEFFSRSGINSGMMTFHPQGIHHGPHKKAVERSADATYTNEVAVMIDTKYPLKISKHAPTLEIENYWKSWQT